jgi:phosphoglucosamine mutase
MPEVTRLVRDVERKLAGEGRVLVRASGTEPKLRIMAEGKDLSSIEEMVNGLARSVKEELG